MIKLGCDDSLPRLWKWVEANEVMDVRDGTHDSPKSVNDGVPLVTSKNLVGGKIDFSTCNLISQEDHLAISKRSAVDDGDILYAMIGTIGNPVIVEKSQNFSIKNVALFKFTKSSEVFNRFIYHFLNSKLAVRQFESNSRGGTQKFVSLGNIRSLKIPLPPLDEQKRIAAILDKADAIRRKRQQAIDLADDFLRSVFLDMFGDPVRNPKGWEVKAVEELSIRVTKGESPKWQGFEYCSSGVRFITSENVLWGKLDNRIKYIPEAFHEKLKRSQVQHGDLLINLVGASVGRACLADIEDKTANINQAVAVTTFNQTEIISELALIQVLLPSVQRVLLGNAVDAARANVSLKNIRELEFVVPPMGLQLEFMERVSVFRELENKFAQSNQSDLFNSLSQKAFAGEL